MKNLVFNLVFVSLAVISATCVTPSMMVTREQQLGDQKFNNYQYDEAIYHYSRMIESSEKLGIYRNLKAEAEVNRKMAVASTMTGQYDRAIDFYRQANVLDSLDNNPIGMIDNTAGIARVHLYKGDFRKGISYLEKAKTESEDLDQSLKSVYRKRVAGIWLSLGQYYNILGEMETSLNYLGRSRNIYEEINDNEGLAEVYLAMAQAYMDKADPDMAAAMLNVSLDKALELEMKPVLQYRLLGQIEATNGEYQKAVADYTRAVDLAGETKIVAQQIWSLIGLGDILIKIGQVEEGMKYIEKAKDTDLSTGIESGSLEASIDMRTGTPAGAAEYFMSQGSVNGQAVACLRSGEYYLALSRHPQAVENFMTAYRLFNSVENDFGKAKAGILLAGIYLDAGQDDSAFALVEEGLELTGFPEIQWQANFLQGRIFRQQNDLENALRSFKKAVEIIEDIRSSFTVDEYKSSFVNDKQEVYDHLIRLLHEMERSEESFLYSEKARARVFLDQINGRDIKFPAGENDKLALQESAGRLEIQKLNKILISSRGEAKTIPAFRDISTYQIEEKIQEARKEYTETITRLKMENPGYFSLVSSEPSSINELQENLDEHSCILEYWIGEEEIIAWIISRNSVSSRRTRLNRASLESSVQLARRFIASNAADRLQPVLRSLYDYLIAPVENELSGYENWLIIPNRGLHFLPFQALMDPEGNYLLDRTVITYAPSASVWDLCHQKHPDPGLNFLGLGLGDLIIGTNAPLPSTGDEVMKISGQFTGSKSLLKEAATETAFKNEAGQYEVLHLASHGIMDFVTPLFSYILLAPSGDDDGLLFLKEIMEIRLNATLVTLSACQTGLGYITEGDELASLSRAFIYAGSSAVISSLWSVADYPTSVLMDNFYRFSKDSPAGISLARAQRMLKEEYPSPFYWAPFIINGDGEIVIK